MDDRHKLGRFLQSKYASTKRGIMFTAPIEQVYLGLNFVCPSLVAATILIPPALGTA